MSRARRVPTVRLPQRRERFGSGVAVSALVHGGLVLALVLGAATSREAFRGLGGPGPAGGGGGGGRTVVRFVELPSLAADQSAAPQAQHEEDVPTVRLTLPRPDLEIVSREMPSLRLTTIVRPVVAVDVGERGTGPGQGRGVGTGTGGGIGSGQGAGVGAGTGPGAGGGRGAAFPPEPRFIIVPADRPKSVRGNQYDVHFWVDDRGWVTRVEVDPPIDDAGYRRTFLDQMLQFQFNPARTTDGRPVSGHVVIPITL